MVNTHARGQREARRRDSARWQATVAAAAIAGGAVAVAVTLSAEFLRYPAWLSAQKADFVIGPALAGLYWLRRRPQSPFGPMLIAWAFVGVLYILQSSANSWLFTIGLFWEKVFGLCTYVLILAFPTGRLDRPAKIVLLVGVVGVLVSSTAIQLLLPQLGAGGSISSCQSLCPRNEIAVTSDPALAADLFELFRYAVLALALAVAGLMVHRFLAGTPPRRRALAIGTPVALLFLVCEILYQLLGIVGAEDSALYDIVSWVFVAARAGVWYGFVFALIAAELFAARTMKRLVEESLHRPSRHELEVMLREPLGDPRLRLHFLDQSAEAGAEFRAIEAGPGRELTVVRRDSTPAVAIDHDAQLSDDPELLNVAGAVALLAAENAQLDASWRSALQELRESRARIVKAGDAERRKIEQNLHDGVQQRLIRTRIDLELARESALTNPKGARPDCNRSEAASRRRWTNYAKSRTACTRRCSSTGALYALKRIRAPSGASLTIDVAPVSRQLPEIESAVYYCCLEAIQNAGKHGGPAVKITVTVRQHASELSFEVNDDGPGFDPSDVDGGAGLQNMRDRIGALDGRLTIIASRGRGAKIAGTVPLQTD